MSERLVAFGIAADRAIEELTKATPKEEPAISVVTMALTSVLRAWISVVCPADALAIVMATIVDRGVADEALNMAYRTIAEAHTHPRMGARLE